MNLETAVSHRKHKSHKEKQEIEMKNIVTKKVKHFMDISI